MSEEAFRGFIAVDVPISDEVLKFFREIGTVSANVKMVEPKNLHITLKFLGDTRVSLINEIESVVADAIENVSPFEMQLCGAGVFPNREYVKVVWIGIGDGAPELERIAFEVDEGCQRVGFKRERRGFSPHLTVGRVKSAVGKNELLEVVDRYEQCLFSIEKVSSVKLMKSVLTPKGPIYSVVSERKLGE